MSRTDGLCGALLGGIMAFGILYGRRSSDDSINKIYALSERLVQDFEKQFGSRNCSDILGCNISAREGETVFNAKKLARTTCLDTTVKTTELVVHILENHTDIKHSMVE